MRGRKNRIIHLPESLTGMAIGGSSRECFSILGVDMKEWEWAVAGGLRGSTDPTPGFVRVPWEWRQDGRTGP